jgi:hypothetical protein
MMAAGGLAVFVGAAVAILGGALYGSQPSPCGFINIGQCGGDAKAIRQVEGVIVLVTGIGLVVGGVAGFVLGVHGSLRPSEPP